MNRLLLILLTFTSLNTFGQNDLKTQTQPIVDEGKRLYKSEMASWFGTDLFLENYKDRANIGGYFSYTNNEISKCVFFSKADRPKVIGTISFDRSFSTKSSKIDLKERDFSNYENDLYTIRKIAFGKLNSDTLFKRYKNTDLNIIPLIYNNEKKVYVLTGPKQNGVVILGNDYLLTFDKNNNLTNTKRLHKNIIPIGFAEKQKDGKEIEATIHSHLPETGDFITATDICTLMLYEKLAKWKSHNVVSKKYLNIWNCETFSRSSFLMESFNVSEQAIKSGFFMKALSEKESIAFCISDLLNIYESKTGIYSNYFVRRCYTVGIKYFPMSLLQSWKYGDIKYQLDKKVTALGMNSYQQIIGNPDLKEMFYQVDSTKNFIKNAGYSTLTSEQYREKATSILNHKTKK